MNNGAAKTGGSPVFSFIDCLYRRSMKQVRLFLTVSFCIAAQVVVAQQSESSISLQYARRVIDTLTSQALNGRGYVDSGDWKAAHFIQHELRVAGVQPYNDQYFQDYRLDANVFPGTMKFSIAGKELVPGIDFLADAGSGPCKGKFKALAINKENSDTTYEAVSAIIRKLSTQNNTKILLFIARDSFSKMQYQLWQQAVAESDAFGAVGIVECSEKKLTWHASQQQLSWCQLQYKGPLPISKNTSVSLSIESKWMQQYKTQNVIGYVKGSSAPDSFVVFTAHYDHLGQMGDGTYFPGANDNASGTSMVLNLAKYYAANPPSCSVVFIFFSGEELGLLGSQYYVNHPLFPLSRIKFLVNLDIVGTGDEGIKVVNATEFKSQFDQLVSLNEKEQLLKVVSPRGKAANSDHYPFYEKGVPCFFIYTMGGISAYHDVLDLPETLPLTEYDDLLKLLTDFVETF